LARERAGQRGGDHAFLQLKGFDMIVDRKINNRF
jgi:hypothetical protein